MFANIYNHIFYKIKKKFLNCQQNEGSGASTFEAETGDGEFEPTVDMLIHDYDDERTLDEEEALEERENREEEINNLTKVLYKA